MHDALPGDHAPAFTCAVATDNKSELAIEMVVLLTDKAKHTRTVRIAWEVFATGFFDADALVDEQQGTLVSPKAVPHIVKLSGQIATGKEMLCVLGPSVDPDVVHAVAHHARALVVHMFSGRDFPPRPRPTVDTDLRETFANRPS